MSKYPTGQNNSHHTQEMALKNDLVEVGLLDQSQSLAAAYKRTNIILFAVMNLVTLCYYGRKIFIAQTPGETSLSNLAEEEEF